MNLSTSLPALTTERCFLQLDSYAWTSAAELAAAIRSKELSAVELMDAVLALSLSPIRSINALAAMTDPRAPRPAARPGLNENRLE